MALTAKKVYAILKRQISDMEAKLNSPVRYRGTVATADLLPLNPDIGDMYNIESKSVYGEAGMNVAWNGVVWDTMGAPIDMSLYIKSSELADWVKQQNKPAYTAEEVGALPADTKIPSKTSDLQNDSGFLTEIPDNYLSGTDKTLSVSGKAADAKATGDKITELSADISNKLNKNQGLENSGKIAGINESGDIVPMFPVSVDYNEETNCLEFGSDQKMELNKGINLDSTLTKTGYAADAGTVGEITNSLKEDLGNVINLSEIPIEQKKYQIGTLYSYGNIDSNIKYRISYFPGFLQFENDMIATVDDGFRAYFQTDASNVNLKQWILDSVEIPAGTKIRLTIARIDEDTTETATIAEFSKAIHFRNCITNSVTALTEKLKDFDDVKEKTIGKSKVVRKQPTEFYVKRGKRFELKNESENFFTNTFEIRLLGKDESVLGTYTLNPTMKSRIIKCDKGDVYYLSIKGETKDVVIANTSSTNDMAEMGEKLTAISDDLTTVTARVTKLEDSMLYKDIPEFYREYLSKRIIDIREKDLLVGNHGMSYIFITDLHDQNRFYSPILAKYISDNTSVNLVVYGGDYINEPNGKDIATRMLFERIAKCRIDAKTIFMRGNHDTNPYGTGQLSESEIYSILNKKNENNLDTKGQLYFFVDNPSQKIRTFFIDTGNDGVVSETQLEWLRANAESIDPTWTVVIFSHMAINGNGKDDRDNVVYYDCVKKVNQIFQEANVKVACWVCGHNHIDMSDTSRNYPIISTTCDAHGAQASVASSDNRDEGTINEQAFDIYHVDTANKKIYVTRIGGGENDVRIQNNYKLNDREFSYR